MTPESLPASWHVGIAGAGLMGRLLAWRLLRAGARVSLHDIDSVAGLRSAGSTAAGMLCAWSEAVEAGAHVLETGRNAVADWAAWLAELACETGERVALRADGSLVVAHSADAAELARFERCLAQRVTAADRAEVIHVDRERLREMEPSLADRFTGALWLRREGCLDNRALFPALAKAIRARNGAWHERVEVEAVGARALRIDGRWRHFDCAVDCRGLGARDAQPALRGVRGEILRVRAPEVRLSRPVRLMHPRFPLYVAPQPDSVYVVGATEIESEDNRGVTVRSGLELLSALYSLDTGFAEAEILEMRVGHRPAWPDNQPRVRAEPGLVSVNGLYRHGYLLGPALVAQAADRVLDQAGMAPAPALAAVAS